MNPLLKDPPQLSKADEHDYIVTWKESQDSKLLGLVLHARARWVWRVIKNMGLPEWVDFESVFSDVMGEVFLAMDGYDPSFGLSAYLYRVIHRSAWKSSQSQGGETADIDFNLIVDTDPGDADNVLVQLSQLIEATPSDELNDTARLLICRILGGKSNTEIASMMGWTYEKTKGNVTHIRRYLAWRMVLADLSAGPWIEDRDLQQLAMEYEENLRGLL